MTNVSFPESTHLDKFGSIRPLAPVTVVIVNWNGGALLARCLEHLSRQTVQPQRVVVVDNGSTDGSVGSLSAFPPVELLELGYNAGFAAANNRAMLNADTEFVALLNPDAFPEPEWIERLVTAAKKSHGVAAFGSRQMAAENPGLLDGIGDVYQIAGLAWRQGKGRQLKDDDLRDREIFGPCAAAALYRRDALVDVGGFDEDYFCYYEDVDLSFRLRLRGYHARYVADAVVHHMGSAFAGRHSDFSLYHTHRNLVWTYVKNMPGLWFWVFLPLHILANIILTLLSVVQGKASPVVRAKLEALRAISSALHKRKTIQGAARARSIELIRFMRVLPWKSR